MNPSFQWKCQPEAEALVTNFVGKCLNANSFILKLQQDLHKYTSTRFFDWIDHVVIEASDAIKKDLEAAGFISYHATATSCCLTHPGAQLPSVFLEDGRSKEGIAVKVDSIADFLMVRGFAEEIEGGPFSAYRRCLVSIDNAVSLWVVERRSKAFMQPVHTDVKTYVKACEMWQSRPRDLEDEEEAMSKALKLAEMLVSMLGEDLAAWVVLECERKFWQTKNAAGAVQKNRQDRLGMGWANHDHHTFRSSRRFFLELVRLFEILGFHCRERFYAGQEAGWGAQVMENARCGLVLFLDLDLGSDELQLDFAHQKLPTLDSLGTVGLWCALHGDSILKAGMHHLEAQFYFDDLKEDLSSHGVTMMEPFSNFSYLKQAFTHGEIWAVDPERVDKLLKKGQITKDQAEKFKKYGAVGSHLENLQRREGYKGFNQKNVSFIIEKTDPRKL